MEPNAGYTRIAVLLHWLLAAALLGQVWLGWWMVELPKSPAGLRAGWFNVHKSVGMTIAIVVLMRAAWRLAHPVPAHHALPRWQRHAAEWSHGLLYMGMLVLPLSGYFGSLFSGYPVRYFGQVLPAWLPPWPAAKQFLSALHLATAWAFMALVLVHVAAAAWHWWRRDGVAARMGLPA